MEWNDLRILNLNITLHDASQNVLNPTDGSGDVLFVCLIWFFTSYQKSFSYIGTGLPGLYQY